MRYLKYIFAAFVMLVTWGDLKAQALTWTEVEPSISDPEKGKPNTMVM